MKKINFLNLEKVNSSYEPALSKAIMDVVQNGWYLYGNYTKKFEEQFAHYCDAKYTVGVASGLDALSLSLQALKIKYNLVETDEVIIPDHTFIATAIAVEKAGLRPVLCDVSPVDYLIDVEKVSTLINQHTKIILPVHLYGKRCDMPSLINLAKKHNLFIIEDAAQAHGFKYSNLSEPCCIAACFSFYPSKNLGALGDAGAVITNSLELSKLIRTLGNYGSEKKYHSTYKGSNSRIDEIQAAALSVKLNHLKKDNEHRRMIAQIYYTIQNKNIELPYNSKNVNSVYHIFPIFTKERELLQLYLQEKGIETLIHYPCPTHSQKAFKEYSSFSFPVSTAIANTELSLPISQILSGEDANYIVEQINHFKP